MWIKKAQIMLLLKISQIMLYEQHLIIARQKLTNNYIISSKAQALIVISVKGCLDIWRTLIDFKICLLNSARLIRPHIFCMFKIMLKDLRLNSEIIRFSFVILKLSSFGFSLIFCGTR